MNMLASLGSCKFFALWVPFVQGVIHRPRMNLSMEELRIRQPSVSAHQTECASTLVDQNLACPAGKAMLAFSLQSRGCSGQDTLFKYYCGVVPLVSESRSATTCLPRVNDVSSSSVRCGADMVTTGFNFSQCPSGGYALSFGCAKLGATRGSSIGATRCQSRAAGFSNHPVFCQDEFYLAEWSFSSKDCPADEVSISYTCVSLTTPPTP